MSDEAPLREFARLAIRRGALPQREPDRAWAGPGVGALCTICERPVTRAQMEYEIQFAHAGANPSLDKYHLHLRCFAAWEMERTKTERTPQPARLTHASAAKVCPSQVAR